MWIVKRKTGDYAVKNKTGVVFLVIGIVLAVAAGILLQGYFSDGKKSEDNMAALRDIRNSALEVDTEETDSAPEQIDNPGVPTGVDDMSEVSNDNTNGENGLNGDVQTADQELKAMLEQTDHTEPVGSVSENGQGPKNRIETGEVQSESSETIDNGEISGENTSQETIEQTEDNTSATLKEGSGTVESAVDEVIIGSPSPTPWAMKEKYILKEEDILPEYRELYKINPELIGWLTIEGTKIDYPVVQTDNPDYYLDHDFYGEKNINGMLVVTPEYDVLTPSQNIVIHGHNMRNGAMFNAITRYSSKATAKKYPFIHFDTLTEHRTYAVVGALYTKLYEDGEKGFRYNVVMNSEDVAKYFVYNMWKESLYKTDYEYDIWDEYLELSTCAYQTKDGRFVVVAKRIDNLK